MKSTNLAYLNAGRIETPENAFVVKKCSLYYGDVTLLGGRKSSRADSPLWMSRNRKISCES